MKLTNFTWTKGKGKGKGKVASELSEASMRRIFIPWSTVYATSTSQVSLPGLDWIAADNIAAARVRWEIAGITNVSDTLQVIPGYQTANIISTVVATGNLAASTQNADGVYFPGSFTDLTSATQGVRWLRPVWRCQLTSGSGLEFARVCGYVDLLPRV